MLVVVVATLVIRESSAAFTHCHPLRKTLRNPNPDGLFTHSSVPSFHTGADLGKVNDVRPVPRVCLTGHQVFHVEDDSDRRTNLVRLKHVLTQHRRDGVVPIPPWHWERPEVAEVAGTGQNEMIPYRQIVGMHSRLYIGCVTCLFRVIARLTHRIVS